MTNPAAKEGDQVMATDTHIVMIPSPGGPVPTPLPHPFTGKIDGGLSSDVNFDGKPAAMLGSTASNTPAHIPQGGPFQVPPTDSATLIQGSTSVFVNGKPAVYNGQTANTCNDPAPAPVGSVIAVGTVMIGS